MMQEEEEVPHRRRMVEWYQELIELKIDLLLARLRHHGQLRPIHLIEDEDWAISELEHQLLTVVGATLILLITALDP